MARVRRNWTPEEDALLRRAVKNAQTQSRPLLWRELAKSVPGRSNKDCRRRWWNSLADGTAKGPWSEKEDESLIDAVRKHGTNWRQVSRDVGSRNADQCSSHWSQVLDPSINYCDWTEEEDEHLLHAVLTHGTNWATIAGLHQPNRTTLALKNRYSTLRLKKYNNKGERMHLSKKTQVISQSSPRNIVLSSITKPLETPPRSLSSSLSDGILPSDEDANVEEYIEEENKNNNNTYQRDSISKFQGEGNPGGNMHIQLPEPGLNTWTEQCGIHSPNSFRCRKLQKSAVNLPPHDTSLGFNDWQYPTPDPSGSYLCCMPDQISLDKSMPYIGHDTTQLDVDLSLCPSFHALPNDLHTPSTSNPATMKEPSPIPCGMNAGIRRTFSSSGSDLVSESQTTYQVSINMACTRAQLDVVMVGLAGYGTCVKVSIDGVV